MQLKAAIVCLLLGSAFLQAENKRSIDPGTKPRPLTETMKSAVKQKWAALDPKDRIRLMSLWHAAKEKAQNVPFELALEKAFGKELGGPLAAFLESTEANPKECAEIPNALCK